MQLSASDNEQWLVLGSAWTHAYNSGCPGNGCVVALTDFAILGNDTVAGQAAVSLQKTWTDPGGANWTAVVELSLKDGSPRVDWSTTISVDDLRVVRSVEGPGLTTASGLSVTSATFGGIEIQDTPAISSEGRWLSTADALRDIPDPDVVTIPAMVAAFSQHQLTMTWDSMQEWSVGFIRPQPWFSARGDHVTMRLLAPRVHEHLYPNESIANTDFYLIQACR